MVLQNSENDLATMAHDLEKFHARLGQDDHEALFDEYNEDISYRIIYETLRVVAQAKGLPHLFADKSFPRPAPTVDEIAFAQELMGNECKPLNVYYEMSQTISRAMLTAAWQHMADATYKGDEFHSVYFNFHVHRDEVGLENGSAELLDLLKTDKDTFARIDKGRALDEIIKSPDMFDFMRKLRHAMTSEHLTFRHGEYRDTTVQLIPDFDEVSRGTDGEDIISYIKRTSSVSDAEIYTALQYDLLAAPIDGPRPKYH